MLTFDKIMYVLPYALLFFCCSSQAQVISQKQQDFMRQQMVFSDEQGAFDQAALAKIAAEIKPYQLVLLGEPNHGSKEVFSSRNELVKYLHSELGFDVILLEAGIGEVAAGAGSTRGLWSAMFGGWRTLEFKELFDYSTQHNIEVAGFDVQRTSGGFKQLLGRVAAPIDSSRWASIEEQFGQVQKLLRKGQDMDAIKEKTETLITDYQKLRESLEVLAPSEDLQMADRTLHNRIQFLTYMLEFRLDRDWSKRWAARDRVMAENVQWLLKNRYGGRKVIIIGHNFHISKYSANEEVMGEFLRNELDQPMFHIGTFSGTGVYANNGGEPEALSPPDSLRLDVKHFILDMQRPMGFVSIPKRATAGSDWLNQTLIVNDSFIDLRRSNTLIPSRHFDALLLIRQSSMPSKP